MKLLLFSSNSITLLTIESDEMVTKIRIKFLQKIYSYPYAILYL